MALLYKCEKCGLRKEGTHYIECDGFDFLDFCEDCYEALHSKSWWGKLWDTIMRIFGV